MDEAPADKPPAAPPAATTPSAAGSSAGPAHALATTQSPEELLKIAIAYVKEADDSGDPWDALLALTYFERAVAGDRKLAAPELLEAMKRMRQLAGKRPYQPPLRGVRYPVYFSAYDEDDQYEVNTDEGTCRTPCVFDMATGTHSVRASGGIKTEITVAGYSRVRLQRGSELETVLGAVLIPTGTLIGAGMWALALGCDSGACSVANIVTWPIIGAGVLTTGIVLLAIADDVPEDANRVETIGLAPVITPDTNGRLRATGAVATLSATF